MKEFTGLRVKTYSYLKDNIDEESKKHKNVFIKKTVCHQKSLNVKTIKTV